MPPQWIFSVTSTFLYRANLPWLKWMTSEWSAASSNYSCWWSADLLHALCAQTRQHKVAFSHNSAQVLFSSSWLLPPVNLYLPCMCALSRVWLSVTPWTVAHQAPLSMGFSRQEYWSGLHFLLTGIFLTQGSNLHFLYLLHWRQILNPLSHQGSPNLYLY